MGELNFWVYMAFLFFGLTAFSLLINSILLRFIKTLGTKNQPGAVVRWSEQAKPAIGGLSFFIVFFMSFSVFSVISESTDIINSPRIIGLMTAATLAFLMGLTDDAYNTKPVLKFLVQIICGIILVQTDSSIRFFEDALLNEILTCVWVVGIMNSVNMLDNMDGIAGSISALIITAALGYIILNDNVHGFNFLILIGLLASIVGFLFFNWNPSVIYMGDTGSQFLGLILSYTGIHFCWNATTISGIGGKPFGVLAVLLVFGIPIIDTTIVTINRLRKGKSPFIGGKDHTTHNLSYFGFSDNSVALIFTGFGLLLAALYILMVAIADAQNFKYVASILLFIFVVLFTAIFWITERNQKKAKESQKSINKTDTRLP